MQLRREKDLDCGRALVLLWGGISLHVCTRGGGWTVTRCFLGRWHHVFAQHAGLANSKLIRRFFGAALLHSETLKRALMFLTTHPSNYTAASENANRFLTISHQDVLKIIDVEIDVVIVEVSSAAAAAALHLRLLAVAGVIALQRRFFLLPDMVA